MKNEFIKMVGKIKNDDLRNVAMTMVDDAPDYFWTVAASSTGKYHPQCDLGMGGLVRHSIMVAQATVDFVRSEIFVEDTEMNVDMAIIAGLFHDILKHGIVAEDGTYNKYTVFNHPILGAEFVQTHFDNANIDADITKVIVGAINSHMGKWNTDKRNPDIVLSVPSTSFQKLVHSADYVASRKYIGGLSDWGYIKSVEHIDLTTEEKDIIEKAITLDTIDMSSVEELEITRTEEEIKDIWNSIYKQGWKSEKQKKYIELAKRNIK